MLRARARAVATLLLTALLAGTTGSTGCFGPRPHVPSRPTSGLYAGAVAPDDSLARLAATLAPVLYLQRDETFQLERVVAAVHPTRRVIAYYLLWSDDAHGAWIPFTTPTDEEVVWVGYDSTLAPTDVWTYWHGPILHTHWPRTRVEIDVQWGKHGSMPRNVRDADLPGIRTLESFYASSIFGTLDLLFGDLNRRGPVCFCHSFDRYRQFTRPLPLNSRLDAVVVGADPRRTLSAVFGKKYSEKPLWPWIEPFARDSTMNTERKVAGGGGH